MIEKAGERLLPPSTASQETCVAEGHAEELSPNIVSYVQHAAGAWMRAAEYVAPRDEAAPPTISRSGPP